MCILGNEAFGLAVREYDVDLVAAVGQQAKLQLPRNHRPLQADLDILAQRNALIIHAPAITEIEILRFLSGIVSAGDANGHTSRFHVQIFKTEAELSDFEVAIDVQRDHRRGLASVDIHHD